MPLEHSPESAAKGPRVKLTEAEVSQLLDEAMARHRQAEALPEKVLSIEDAVEIARTMGIPEEHVHAAAAELQRRRPAEAPVVLEAAELARRRDIVRSRRAQKFYLSLGLSVFLTVAMWGLVGASGGSAALLLLLTGGVLAAVLGTLARWLWAPVTPQELEKLDVPPPPGRCRVCGARAYTPQATFCEQHRYKGPG